MQFVEMRARCGVTAWASRTEAAATIGARWLDVVFCRWWGRSARRAPRNWRGTMTRVRVPALAQRLARAAAGWASPYGLQQLEHITAAPMTC